MTLDRDQLRSVSMSERSRMSFVESVRQCMLRPTTSGQVVCRLGGVGGVRGVLHSLHTLHRKTEEAPLLRPTTRRCSDEGGHLRAGLDV